jgi:dTDP-4-amino-4,6-dideoxygalactose transaminase
VYNTLEGGAITGDGVLIDRLKRRRNFGLSREEQLNFGTNGKMDELRAAIGLLNLRSIDQAIAARARVARFYLDVLPGETDLIELFPDLLFPSSGRHNHAYFPAVVRPEAPVTRDGLLESLMDDGILARRYFYPTPTTSRLYRDHVSPEALPVTRQRSLDTICLPIHHGMSRADCAHVVDSLVRALRS